MRPVTDAQVRKLMEEMSKHGRISDAAMKAGMDRKTARKYVAAGELPSEMVEPRDWRTRQDPFEEHWPEMEARLRATPGLEAKTLFELLQEKYPGRYEDGQLRTLQRHVKRWRAEHGPEREIVLAQQHRPGEAAQTDFTWTTELAMTIAGQLFVHLLCVLVLPYSNWQWATVCLSESMAALRKGVQRRCSSSGACRSTTRPTTRRRRRTRSPTASGARRGQQAAVQRRVRGDDAALRDEAADDGGRREGAKRRRRGEQRRAQAAARAGAAGARQPRLRERRGVAGVRRRGVRKANANRGRRVAEDLAAMRELDVAKLPEYVEEEVRVSDWSTMRVKHCAYSVPSRLIGEWVRVRIFEDRIEVRFADKLELACERLRGAICIASTTGT